MPHLESVDASINFLSEKPQGELQHRATWLESHSDLKLSLSPTSKQHFFTFPFPFWVISTLTFIFTLSFSCAIKPGSARVVIAKVVLDYFIDIVVGIVLNSL
jgi:hypothetical protein